MPRLFSTGPVEDGFSEEVSDYGEAFEFLQVQAVLLSQPFLHPLIRREWTYWWFEEAIRLSADWAYRVQEDLQEDWYII